MSRRLAAAAAASTATMLAGMTTGCGGGRSIVLYNGQHPQLTSAIVATFERQTGIDVRVRSDDSVVLADQILSEGSASAADVYLAENSPELTALEERHLLRRLADPILKQAPRRHSSAAGDWVAVALRVGSLAFDPALLAPSALPSSILTLSQPQWKGRIAVAPADSDFVPLVGALIAEYGQTAARRWLAGLKRNAQIFENDESVVAAVNRGDVASGLVNSYYWFRLRLELGAHAMHSRLHYFPNGDVGSLQNTSGAAVLESSAHARDAEAFVRFLVSDTAQRIISRGDDFEYPARSGVPPNMQLPSLRSIAPPALTPSALGDDRLASSLIRSSGLV